MSLQVVFASCILHCKFYFKTYKNLARGCVERCLLFKLFCANILKVSLQSVILSDSMLYKKKIENRLTSGVFLWEKSYHRTIQHCVSSLKMFIRNSHYKIRMNMWFRVINVWWIFSNNSNSRWEWCAVVCLYLLAAIVWDFPSFNSVWIYISTYRHNAIFLFPFCFWIHI